jgi:demethylmenaquinone methyltransferase/2-methoxy-6-polyprenyl-1,4-benzoquinol methylase
VSPLDWSRLAPAYERQLGLERPALRALLDLLDVGEHEVLLDVGTGTGGLLRELERGGERPARAVGVDESRAMLDRSPPLPSGWELVVADARRLPFGDASFDVATAAWLLHVLDDRAREQVIVELRRVLRPGGRLGVITFAPSPRPRLWRALEALSASSGPLAGARPLDPRAALLAAGFDPREVRRVRRGYPSLCVTARR